MDRLTPSAWPAGGGELGALIRRFDWARTPLGPIESWPQSLRTVTELLLLSPVALVLLWGEEGIMIYNDAYSSFAAGRHPALLGSKVREGWPEVAAFNDRVMRVGLAGGTLAFRDQELTLYRSGAAERVWMDLAYSPVLDESGKPAGVLAVVIETTERVHAERALRIERDRSQGILDSMGEGFMLLDPELCVLQVNAEAIRLLQLPRGEIIGRRHADLWPAAEEGPAVELYRRAMRDRRSASLEYRCARPDGREIWIDLRVYPASEGLAVFFRDVTARKQTEQALLRSEAEFRAVAEALPNHVWAATPDGRLEWFNERIVEYAGLTAPPPDFRALGAIMHPADVARVEQHWTEARARRRSVQTEFRLRRADGAYRWHLTRAVPVQEADAVARWIGTNTDIEDERAAAEALRSLNETLEARVEERTAERDRLWQYSQDLFAILDTDGVFQSVSPAAATILGWRPEEMVGRSVFEFVHPDDHAASERALVQTRHQYLPVYENRCRHRDGSYRWLSWVAAPGGGLIYATGRHITAEKQARAELAAAQEALRQSQKMEAVGQLTGGLAHDFNNLLTGITGSLELIAARCEQGRTDEIGRYLEAAIGAAKRAAALTHRLLAFSRRQTLDPKPTNVNRLVLGLEELIRRTVGPAVTVETLAAPQLWITLVDSNQLENALLNLCINARDAMPDGGRLMIATENRRFDGREAAEYDLRPGDYVRLAVGDTGIGMTEEIIARAFDPFFTTKPIGMGTGLGLSMIHGFVQQSGGQVRIRSELGKGTTVSLYLPRHAGQEQPIEPGPPARKALPASRGETVLVVDDEPTVRMLVVEALKGLDYAALEAADAAAGLRLVRSGAPIDLLVTDVGLPGGMNGRQLADAVRALRPGLKVLFITGYAENAVLNHGDLEPGMHVMTKPFEMTTLACRIQELIAG